jgi:hypothetical protein
VEKRTNLYLVIFKMFEQQLENREEIKKVFSEVYDQAFNENKSQLVDALDLATAPSSKPSTRNMTASCLAGQTKVHEI